MTEQSGHRLVSITSAAEYLACNQRTIRRRIADGTLTGYRLGRMIRVDLNQLDAMLGKTVPRSVSEIGAHFKKMGAEIARGMER